MMRRPSDEVQYWQPKIWREQCLSQLSELLEQYMRSPAFMTWLTCSIAIENARSRWFRPAGSTGGGKVP